MKRSAWNLSGHQTSSNPDQLSKKQKNSQLQERSIDALNDNHITPGFRGNPTNSLAVQNVSEHVPNNLPSDEPFHQRFSEFSYSNVPHKTFVGLTRCNNLSGGHKAASAIPVTYFGKVSQHIKCAQPVLIDLIDLQMKNTTSCSTSPTLMLSNLWLSTRLLIPTSPLSYLRQQDQGRRQCLS